jgi:hypothetical protein
VEQDSAGEDVHGEDRGGRDPTCASSAVAESRPRSAGTPRRRHIGRKTRLDTRSAPRGAIGD